ncbi:MAG: amino acid ABC transporter substrate-binding protein [Burkholderiales bacterium]
MSPLVRRLAAVALAGAAALASAQGFAAPREWPGALSARMQQIRETGVVRLGYRDGAIPFSYVGPDGRPVGYSLDLCLAVVATLADDLGVPTLRAEYVRVTPVDRVERVVSGAVDLECGSTTITRERRERVAFSPVIFVTGTRLAVPVGSAIRGLADVAGRRVAVVGGTTNEAAMRDVDRLRGLGLAFVVAGDYRDALALLSAGRADALAADEALLRGALAETRSAPDFRIVGPMLSFEPYGLMAPRGEPVLADAVDRTLRALAASREIVWIYDRWFVRPLPGGLAVGMPMGVELRRSFEVLGLPPD